MASMIFRKVSALPSTFEPDAVYLVSTAGGKFKMYLADNTGTSVKEQEGAAGGGGGNSEAVVTSVSRPDPVTTAENFWWNPSTDSLYIKETIASQPTWTIVVDSKPITPKTLESVLYYYGNPLSYMGLLSIPAIADEIASNYKYWVMATGLQNPAHPNYTTTVQIIQAVRDRGLKVYGNIPIDTTSSNYSVSQISTMADQWKTIAVDGIFLDKYGFDGGSTRQRQIDIVTTIRGKSLLICASSYESEEFMTDTLAQTGWASGDNRYSRWQTQNPLDQASPVQPGDTYVMPEFCYNTSGPLNFALTQKRAQTASSLCKSKQVSFWTQTTFGESSPGTVNPVVLGNLNTLEMSGDYISATAYLFDVLASGSAGASYGSNGTPVSAPLRKLPYGAETPAALATVTNATSTAGRYFGSTYVFVTNTTSQYVTVTGKMKTVAEKELIGSDASQAPSNSMLGTAAYTDSTAYATADQGALASTAVQPGLLATVATTGVYGDLTGKPTLAAVATSGAYGDLTGKPSLATIATSGAYSDLTGTPTLSAVAISGNYADLYGTPVLSTVATTGAYSDLSGKPVLSTVATSGSYTDLSNKPTIPAAQVQVDWNATTGITSILNKPSLSTVATTGAYSDLSERPTLATVSTSGSYNDLSDKPTIPAAQIQVDWNATAGITSILNKPTLATVATTGTYSDLSGVPTLATVATTGSYTDLSNQPTIPDAQVQTDWNAVAGISAIANKPAVIAAGATSADARSSIGAIPEAPSDSQNYARRNGDWTAFVAGDVTLNGNQTLTNKQISGSNNTLTVDGTNKVGYLTIPPNSITTSYELALSDIGKSITKSVAGDMALTIFADTVLAFPVGATVSIINSSASGTITIFSADTLVWSPEGTTGSRVLAPNGMATITKVPDSKWMIVGAGLT